MFFRDLKPKKGVTLNVTLAHVHLPVRLGNRDAAKVFVTPLSHQLAAAGLGTVAGFDAHLKDEENISGIDIYLGMTNASRPALQTVARMLEHLRAPYGSSIRLSEAPANPLLFGVSEGLELSIQTQAAPDAAARRELANTCREAIEDQAVSRGWSRRDDVTLFYFYGESFARMKEKLTKALEGDARFSTAVLRRMA